VGISVEELFGRECSGTIFRYDQEMMKKVAEAESPHVHIQSQTTASSRLSDSISPLSKRRLYLATLSPVDEHDGTSRFLLKDLDVEAAPLLLHIAESEVSSPVEPKFIQRNEQGRLRSFDAHANELDVVSRAPKSVSKVPLNLRRKSSFTDLETSNKRYRLSLDGSNSPAPDSLTGQRSNPYSISSDDCDSDNPDTPGSTEDSGEPQVRNNSLTFFDPVDEVYRCLACSHEVWGGENGTCTRCDEGAFEPPYVEETFGHTGPLPQISLDEYMDEVVVDSTVVKELVGDCLDYGSSAYDSQDSADKFDEEYEVNSFIDDEEIPEPESEEDESQSSSSEVDWEAKFKELQTQHLGLQNNFDDLAERHYEFQREVLGSDMSDDDDDIDEDDFDENGMLIIDVTPPDPIATDIVLSQAREQSQESEVSDERIRHRAEAFEAARDGGWHDVELASVSGNHTHAEIEL